MNGTIRQTVELAPSERTALFGNDPDPFGVAHLGLQWRGKEIQFLLEEAGRPVARVGVLRHELDTDRSSILLAGIGGVFTAKEARGRGHATALIRHVLGHVEEAWHVDAALLFCLADLVPFYGRQGFELVTPQVLIDQPTGQLPAPIPVMVRTLSGRTWPEGSITLASLPW